jgi:hypothetical protein
MKRTLAMLLPVVAMLFWAGGAWADAASPGSCFGDENDHSQYKKDAGVDGKLVRGQPTRSDTRRAGVGLLSAAFVTSGWLVLRRQDLKR